MESYRDQENGIDLNINKEDIKKEISKLLINSEYFLGIKIVEFHYFIVGLYIEENLNNIYESEKKNYNEIMNFSQNLKNYCIKNDLEIIFYDPITKNFYDSSKNLSEQIKLIGKSNLFKCVLKNKVNYLINERYLNGKKKEEINY